MAMLLLAYNIFSNVDFSIKVTLINFYLYQNGIALMVGHHLIDHKNCIYLDKK